ncbi:S8 family serine peptidase, partial [Calothrix rhizosoleniae]|uniref:S8 family serine peptidase n=1 Tax=Calothrix rhizosoleniae TaxID=888997 RepID=UPI0013562CB0
VSLLAKGTSPTNHISGLTGNGEIIAIADTGLDLQIGENTVLHPDFDGRIKKIKSCPIKPSYSSSRVHNPHGDDGASDKYSGHGTHVAGSALGNGTMAQNYGLPPIQGMAPEAELIFQAIEQTPQWTEQEIIKSVVNLRKIPPASNLSGIPSNLKVLFEFAYNNGARIHSNSWGGSGSDRCRQVDTFVWENKNFLIVFAAGNEGNQKRTITPPGTAKNCITVGASDEFSSRGPCEDGRLKPDVIAPGAYILSTRSCQITHHSEAPYPPVKDFYMYTSGTSMATPLVAGSAALVREYFRTRKRIDDPSAALVKAALIHSADYKRETSSQKWADDKQGWGMINLSRIIDRPAPYAIEFFDRSQGFSDSGEQHNYQFEITNDSIPLRVTLVYTDYPDEKLIGKLVNNLNLEVYNPKDKYYCGNDFDDEGKKDYLNNVEGCIINTPIEGKWKIRIVGETIAQPPQDYALIVSGAFINWQFNL